MELSLIDSVSFLEYYYEKEEFKGEFAKYHLLSYGEEIIQLFLGISSTIVVTIAKTM